MNSSKQAGLLSYSHHKNNWILSNEMYTEFMLKHFETGIHYKKVFDKQEFYRILPGKFASLFGRTTKSPLKGGCH